MAPSIFKGSGVCLVRLCCGGGGGLVRGGNRVNYFERRVIFFVCGCVALSCCLHPPRWWLGSRGIPGKLDRKRNINQST